RGGNRAGRAAGQAPGMVQRVRGPDGQGTHGGRRSYFAARRSDAPFVAMPPMPLCLLDTDSLSEVLKQKHPVVVQKASAYLAQYQQFAFSSVTRYEIVRGLKAKKA